MGAGALALALARARARLSWTKVRSRLERAGADGRVELQSWWEEDFLGFGGPRWCVPRPSGTKLGNPTSYWPALGGRALLVMHPEAGTSGLPAGFFGGVGSSDDPSTACRPRIACLGNLWSRLTPGPWPLCDACFACLSLFLISRLNRQSNNHGNW